MYNIFVLVKGIHPEGRFRLFDVTIAGLNLPQRIEKDN
jgi:hypothetical protein